MKNYETGLGEHLYRYRKMIEFGSSTLSRYLFFEHTLRKSLKPVPLEVWQAYQHHRPAITEFYGQNQLQQKHLFHGTGRYQYQTEVGSKYRNPTLGKVGDVLSTVLVEGLQPKDDIWVPTPANQPTISLTHQRFYARWYADKHNYQPLLWSYGDTTDWASMFIVKNISQLLDIPYIATLLLKFQIKKNSENGLLGSVHNWVGDVRDDISPRTSYLEALKTRSTISGNFGTVFAVQEKDVSTYDFPLLQRTELRTLNPISPESISAVEVPLRKLKVVNELLGENNLTWIKVLPTECVDYHLSTFPLTELTNVDEQKLVSKVDPQSLDITQINFFPLTCEDLISVLDNENYTPQKLLDLLSTSPILNTLLSQKCNWEGFSIYYHTLSCLHLFEQFFSCPNSLPSSIRRDFFKVFLSLHDIGDSLGKHTVEKLAYNQLICVKLLSDLGFNHQEILIARALLSDDPLGSYLKKVGSITQLYTHSPAWLQLVSLPHINQWIDDQAHVTRIRIKNMAEIANMSYQEFLQLLTTFHMVDAGSYTSMGGTIGSLNYVFEFSKTNNTMAYSSTVQNLVSLL